MGSARLDQGVDAPLLDRVFRTPFRLLFYHLLLVYLDSFVVFFLTEILLHRVHGKSKILTELNSGPFSFIHAIGSALTRPTGIGILILSIGIWGPAGEETKDMCSYGGRCKRRKHYKWFLDDNLERY